MKGHVKTGAMHAVEPGTATRLPVQGVHAGLLLPVLDMDGRAVCDSKRIVEWLDETQPEG